MLRSYLRSFVVFLLTIWSIPALAEVTRGSGYGFPHDASLEGHRIDELINETAVMVGILFIIMVIWMAIAMIKHGKDHKAEYEHGNTKHHIKHALVISSLIFLIVDGNLFVNSVIDMREAFWNFDRAAGKDAVRLEINARQWAWEARYAGPDGKFATADDIVTLNDIRVPVNTPISVQLASVDVIHSLYLPNFRVKTDAVPGTITRTWFQATETGEFDIACAQHCGTHHYKMMGKLTVHSKKDFERWATEASVNSQLDFDPSDSVEAAFRPNWGWKWQQI